MIKEIQEAVKILKEGGVILYPTDTIWGLGCDATNPEAVEKIYQIKQRADSKSLIILANNLDMVYKYVKEVPELAIEIAEISTTPLTIIYPQAINLASNTIAEDKSIAIRIPAHEFCQELIKNFRRPIVSTSANISGTDFPRSFQDITADILSQADWIADPIYEKGASNGPSSILKVSMNGIVKIIRE